MIAVIAQAAQRIGSPALGIIIPAAVFALSFFVAFILYRHFIKKMEK